MRNRAKPIQILLVEDNPGDVLLTQEAFRRGKVHVRLEVAEDGVEALRRLRREGEHKDYPRPDLILLDLNLPKKNGFEVLAELKESDELRRIPVVVLTSSGAEKDILQTYDLYANCFIQKPVDLNQFIKAMSVIDEFWFTVVKLPEGHAA